MLKEKAKAETEGSEDNDRGENDEDSNDYDDGNEKDENVNDATSYDGAGRNDNKASGIEKSSPGEKSDMKEKTQSGPPPPIPERKALLYDGIRSRELVRKIAHNFGPQALEQDVETEGSYLKAEVLWFQLLRYVQDLFGVVLVEDVEIELLESGPRPLEYPDDVESSNPDFSDIAADDWEADQKLQIERTDQFQEALNVLGEPCDVYRLANPNDFGADFSPQQRQMFNCDEGRSQHLLAFDRIPSPTGGALKEDRGALLKLTPVGCSRVRLVGDSGAVSDLLTWTAGVEAIFMPGAVDDFTLM